jgi:hypothetical protein
VPYRSDSRSDAFQHPHRGGVAFAKCGSFAFVESLLAAHRSTTELIARARAIFVASNSVVMSLPPPLSRSPAARCKVEIPNEVPNSIITLALVARASSSVGVDEELAEQSRDRAPSTRRL